MTEWVRPNCCISSVTPCAIIPKDLEDSAPRADTDFIDFGEVERGPDAGNCLSQLLFWNSTFFAIFVESGCCLELRGVSRWLKEVSSCVQADP